MLFVLCHPPVVARGLCAIRNAISCYPMHLAHAMHNITKRALTRKKTLPPGRVFLQLWRWGESNPRPAIGPKDFSGCSLLTISQPSATYRPATEWAQSTKCRWLPVDMEDIQWLYSRRQEPGLEQTPGLTDFSGPCGYLGGKNEVSAFRFSTYFFARFVYEMSAHPRPASPRSTTVVETDHPLCTFHTGLSTSTLAYQIPPPPTSPARPQPPKPTTPRAARPGARSGS